MGTGSRKGARLTFPVAYRVPHLAIQCCDTLYRRDARARHRSRREALSEDPLKVVSIEEQTLPRWTAKVPAHGRIITLFIDVYPVLK